LFYIFLCLEKKLRFPQLASPRGNRADNNSKVKHNFDARKNRSKLREGKREIERK